MSNKHERIRLLIATRTAICQTAKFDKDNRVTFDETVIKEVLGAIDKVLQLDGVHCISMDTFKEMLSREIGPYAS